MPPVSVPNALQPQHQMLPVSVPNPLQQWQQLAQAISVTNALQQQQIPPVSISISNPLQQQQQQMPPHSVAHVMQQIVQPQLDNNSNPSSRMSTPVPHPSPQKEKEVDEHLAKLELGTEMLLTYFKPTVKLTNITPTKAAPQTPSKTSPQSSVKKYTETPPKRISSPVKPISLIKIPEKNVQSPNKSRFSCFNNSPETEEDESFKEVKATVDNIINSGCLDADYDSDNHNFVNSIQEEVSNDEDTSQGFFVEASSQPPVNTNHKSEIMIQDKLGMIKSKTFVHGKEKKLHQKHKVTSRTSKITQTLPKAPKRARITLPNYRIIISPVQHRRNLALARKNRELLAKKLGSQTPVPDQEDIEQPLVTFKKED